MFRRLLTLVVLALFWVTLAVAPASAAPGKPIMPRGCYWNGLFYPNGAIRTAHYPAYDDYYRCDYGNWVYIGSSDDRQ
jgi:hypothetical protein